MSHCLTVKRGYYVDYQAPENLLTDRIILVSGAGDGIGKEAALTYARHGATVILLGKTVRKLESTYDAIVAQGGQEPAIIALDMMGATGQHYQQIAESIREQFGRLDGALLNAGILGVLSPLAQYDEKTWREVMQVNVTAQFLLAQALLPLLHAAPSASLVFTSSSVGKKGRAFWGAYAVSKFATEGMMQVLADELENTQVRVNCINPGGTRTGMRAKAFPAENPELLKTAAEIMPVYLYLMGDDSKQENGQSFDAQPNRLPGIAR
ncbi:YciK family oxidoreductase [Plesiomonas shigelloides]|nr:YciK family oxidoreductase [Plesiomonas shigelloides]PVU66298.1 YciK family oxidoreductase [Plesiomonas shigelloides]